MCSRARVYARLAACVLVIPSAALAQTRTAAELVEIIVRDGPRAIAIRSDVDVVRREQAARLAFVNPAVSYSREGAGFSEFLEVEAALPAFGARRALTRAGVAATTAAEAERDARLWALRAEAARAVAGWAWAAERSSALSAEVQIVAQLVDVLRAREREGESSRLDRLRAEQELADLQQSATTAAIDVVHARGAVRALLPAGVTVNAVATPPSLSTRPIDPAALWERARGARAELRTLAAAGEHASLEAIAARRARGPAPLMLGGFKRSDAAAGRERGGVFGMSVTLPVFDTGSKDAARWTAEGVRLAAERAAIEHQIRAEIERAAEALALRRQALADAAVDASGPELVATAEVAYREGEIGITAYLDAVRTASRARMRDMERRLHVQLAEIALEGAVGEVLWR